VDAAIQINAMANYQRRADGWPADNIGIQDLFMEAEIFILQQDLENRGG
jgi:hypothetical protein